MDFEDIVEIDDDAEMVDLGIASIGTEGVVGPYFDGPTMMYSSPSEE